MTGMFGAEFFINNRQRLVKLAEDMLIVVPANGLIERSGDTTFPFCQDSSFWYLTGIREPDFTLIIDSGKPALVLPEREPSRDLWEGKIDIKSLAKQSGIEKFISKAELSRRIKSAKKIARPAPLRSYIKSSGFFTNPARTELEKLLKAAKAKPIDIRLDIARLRQVKQPIELEAIQKAVDITLAGLEEVKAELFNFKSEDQIAHRLTAAFAKAGAEGHAYQPIVAGGKNATTLHYVKNEAPLNEGELLLIDAGAEWGGYAADISRTWPIGKIGERQALILEIVGDVQRFAYDQLKPGIFLKEYDKKVHKYLADQLVKRNVFTDLESAAQACPHAISHFLGLDVHDAADYEIPLAENMVLTVEPGVYLSAEGIGVRIEDNVVITKTGCRVLSRSPANS